VWIEPYPPEAARAAARRRLYDCPRPLPIPRGSHDAIGLALLPSSRELVALGCHIAAGDDIGRAGLMTDLPVVVLGEVRRPATIARKKPRAGCRRSSRRIRQSWF
jgi:hypothetical protein